MQIESLASLFSPLASHLVVSNLARLLFKSARCHGGKETSGSMCVFCVSTG